MDVLSDSTHQKGVCPTNIVIFEKSNPKAFKKFEDKSFSCPQYDRTTLFDFETPAHLDHGPNLHLSVSKLSNTPHNQRLYRIKLLDRTTLDLDLELDFAYDDSPASIYLQPMSQDKKYYFANLKKAGLKAYGKYVFEGKRYECEVG